MRKLLHRVRHGDFAMANGGWTSDISKALEFPSLDRITTEIQAKYAPDEVELYYAFGTRSITEYDFSLTGSLQLRARARTGNQNGKKEGPAHTE